MNRLPHLLLLLLTLFACGAEAVSPATWRAWGPQDQVHGPAEAAESERSAAHDASVPRPEDAAPSDPAMGDAWPANRGTRRNDPAAVARSNVRPLAILPKCRRHRWLAVDLN